MDGVILAAGRGTRMGPLTTNRPKPLLPVAGTSLIEHVLAAAVDSVDRFTIVTGYGSSQVRDHLGSSYRNVPIRYLEQAAQRGTADAVATALEAVDPPFLVLNGDVLVGAHLIERLVDTTPPALVGTTVDNPTEYGVLSVDGDRLVELVEKPNDPPSDLINAGAYLVDAGMADRITAVDESERGEYELTDAIMSAVDAGLEVTVVAHDGFWLDVGYPWDLLTGSEHLLDGLERRLDGYVAEGATIQGSVVVEPGAEVRDGAVIRGPAIVRTAATVGPNAYVRDGVVLGEGVRVGHAVEVKRSVLMTDTHVAHLSYVGDSVLGEGVNLGAGTTVANLRHDGATVHVPIKGESRDTGRQKFGVVLGDGVKTGINTSLNVGVVLPCEAMTAPGEVVLQAP